MKSLARLLISHVFISIFVTFFLLSGHIEHPFLIIFLLFLPVLNKGQRFQKIQSKKRRLLNASLCFILSTTFNKSYGLEIPGISNNLYHF